MAFSVQILCKSRNEAEAKAAWFGGRWCIHNCHTSFIIEMDSLLIANMLNEGKSSSFKLNKIIEEIASMLSQARVKVTHCYREATCLAAWMAKMATSSQESHIYHSIQQLPQGEKGPLLMDMRQIPSIRSKFDKANFFVS